MDLKIGINFTLIYFFRKRVGVTGDADSGRPQCLHNSSTDTVKLSPSLCRSGPPKPDVFDMRATPEFKSSTPKSRGERRRISKMSFYTNCLYSAV